MNGELLGEDEAGRPPDRSDAVALEVVRRFFDENRGQVMFSRQVEVIHELEWFHWITNRALRHLVGTGELKSERRQLRTGGGINLLWHRSHRYYKRDAARLTALVEEYADPNIGAALGL